MDAKTLGDIIRESPELKKMVDEAKKENPPVHSKSPKFKTEEDPISFVKVEVGYKSGNVAHIISDEDYSIDDFSYQMSRKTQKVKGDEGEFLGFEPTGEYVLTIKVKYTKPQ